MKFRIGASSKETVQWFCNRDEDEDGLGAVLLSPKLQPGADGSRVS
jgi:hypothetical protein